MTTLTPIAALPRDIKKASAELGLAEVKYLVDLFYASQDFRKATANQVRSMEEEPHETLAFFEGQFEQIEGEIKKALDVYSMSDPLGKWCRAQYGCGPVIAAGLLAHIDIAKAPTVGHIWRFAGLDPTVKWRKGEKRPWNADLKLLCWKLGDSFTKFSGREECFYGQIYVQRKQYEIERNESGGNAAVAAETLEEKPNHKQAAAYKEGKLPDGRLDLRARRYAVKLFLAGMHEVGYCLLYEEPPPKPYSLVHLGHAHEIAPPHAPEIVQRLRREAGR